MQKEKEMKLITINMDLVIDDEDCLVDSTTNGQYYDKDKIARYLNNKLYTDPEFFGDFGNENIISVKEIE
jgi:hypothetical protein